MVLSATSVWNGRCAVVADFLCSTEVLCICTFLRRRRCIGITIDERQRRACWFRPGPYSGLG